jgi:site-specific recombinase XerD
MTTSVRLAPLLERFFTQRLMQERRVSPHTIGSYRDTFRLLLKFTHGRLHKSPSALVLEEIDAPLIKSFLNHLEKQRGVTARTRNLRLTAIRSFFRYIEFELPTHSEQIQRLLHVPQKLFTRKLVPSLTREEVDALLAAPNRRTWFGQRDYAFILLAAQTGLRLSEITGVTREDLVLSRGAHVRVIGKGRKERCMPLAKPTVAVLKAWLREPSKGNGPLVFTNFKGERLTVHGVKYMLNKHTATAAKACPSLKTKKVTVHRLRHAMAMDMLQEGEDRAIIALWLGHNSVETTQMYLDATLAMKEKALAKLKPRLATPVRFRPGDRLLNFLSNL